MRNGDRKNIFGQNGTYGSIKKIGKTPHEPMVGKFCSIASGVRWLTVSHHTDWITSFPFSVYSEYAPVDFPEIEGLHPVTYERLLIGNDVYIGMDTLFVGDITVGNGAIIGAGSVVRMDVEPYSIVFGNPARFCKYKIPKVYIEDMERIAWWDWSLKKIAENSNLLCSKHVEDFINLHRVGRNNDGYKSGTI